MVLSDEEFGNGDKELLFQGLVDFVEDGELFDGGFECAVGFGDLVLGGVDIVDGGSSGMDWVGPGFCVGERKVVSRGKDWCKMAVRAAAAGAGDGLGIVVELLMKESKSEMSGVGFGSERRERCVGERERRAVGRHGGSIE